MNYYRASLLALNETIITKRKHELTKNEPNMLRLIRSVRWGDRWGDYAELCRLNEPRAHESICKPLPCEQNEEYSW